MNIKDAIISFYIDFVDEGKKFKRGPTAIRLWMIFRLAWSYFMGLMTGWLLIAWFELATDTEYATHPHQEWILSIAALIGLVAMFYNYKWSDFIDFNKAGTK
jgi:hypothetical protein